MWLMRGIAGLGVLALAACGGPEPRGQLSVAPRPELTVPPGEMSTQRLVLMKATTGDNKGKSVGSIAIAPDSVGVVMRLELRNLAQGAQVITLNEDADCSADEVDGKVVLAAGAGKPWGPDGTPVKLPALDVPSDGQVRTEFVVPTLLVGDTRGRSIVITKGGERIACGVAQ